MMKLIASASPTPRRAAAGPRANTTTAYSATSDAVSRTMARRSAGPGNIRSSRARFQ